MTKQNSGVVNIKDKAKNIYDTLTNLVANMGTANDKRALSTFSKRGKMNRLELEALYREDWIGGKIIDIIPNEMTREWRTFNDSKLKPEEIELIKKAEEDLKLKYKFNEAKRWARLYGGALIVMNIEDTGEPHEPLDIDRIKEGALKSIIVYDSQNVSYQSINNTDPFRPNFLMPETYSLARTNMRIHYTRVLRFEGTILPMNDLQQNGYWHDSVFNRIYDALKNANISNDSTAGLLFDSNVDVIKIKNLFSMLSTDEGTKQIQDRFLLAKVLKANNNVTLLDSEEGIVKHINSFAGLPDVLDRFMQIISASSDIPATRLFGKAPVGMNATGESDLRNFYDSIRSMQEFEFAPILNEFDKILAKHLGLNPDNMSYSFDTLWQVSDKETAEIKRANSESDQRYYDMGIINSSIIAKQLKEEGSYSNITDEHITMLEEMEKELEEELEEDIDEEDDNGDDSSDTPEGKVEEQSDDEEVEEEDEDSEGDKQS